MTIKNINLGKIKFILFFYLFTQFQTVNGYTDEPIYFGTSVDIKILDKLSSKSKLLKLKIGKDYIFKNLNLKVLKCKNSEFDDDPEIIAYVQVRDLTNKNKDDVFVFNGWMFSSSPSIAPFDHPVYDVWLVKCY